MTLSPEDSHDSSGSRDASGARDADSPAAPQPQDRQATYGHGQHGQQPQSEHPVQYSQHPQYGQAGPQYGQQAHYGQAPYGQPQYGQAPYGQQGQYGQPGYGYAPTHGGAPYPGAGNGAGPRPSVTLRQALRNWWSYKFLFTGRASMSEYWWVQLVLFLGMLAVEFVLGLIVAVVAAASNGETGAAIAFFLLYLVVSLLALAVVVLTLGLVVRRLHDANFSGLWYLAVLFPFLGSIAVLVMTLMPSNPLGQRFDTPQDQHRP